MKRFAPMMLALFVAVVLLAPITTILAGGKSHEAKGEVVSVDLEGKKLTFKNEKGEDQTAPVMGKALETLKTLKAGDKVTLTCADNEKGEHQGISEIKVTPAGGK